MQYDHEHLIFFSSLEKKEKNRLAVVAVAHYYHNINSYCYSYHGHFMYFTIPIFSMTIFFFFIYLSVVYIYAPHRIIFHHGFLNSSSTVATADNYVSRLSYIFTAEI